MTLSFLSIPFFWIFFIFYLLHELVALGLMRLNQRQAQNQKTVPAFFAPYVSPDVFAKSRAYTLTKQKFGLWRHALLLPFFWILVACGGFAFFEKLSATVAGAGTIPQSILFCVLVSAYFALVQLPFQLYSTFVIEQKFGFNKMTPLVFVLDRLKGLALAAVLGLPLLYAFFAFMRYFPNTWWLWAWGLLVAFQMFAAAVFPTFIAPLFNKFQPLEEGELKQKITALAQKIGFKMAGVFVVDGSKRSGHSNAYFAGLGRFRRIVLFDTLIRQMSTDELIAVLAHEMGHNAKKHIQKSLVISSILSLLSLFILSKLVAWPDFYAAFSLTPSTHAAVMIFTLCLDVFTFPLTPLFQWLSRKNEFEADRFSADTTNQPQTLQTALIKLTQENLSQLEPHPWYSFFHYSHPTTRERVLALQTAADRPL